MGDSRGAWWWRSSLRRPVPDVHLLHGVVLQNSRVAEYVALHVLRAEVDPAALERQAEEGVLDADEVVAPALLQPPGDAERYSVHPPSHVKPAFAAESRFEGALRAHAALFGYDSN